MGSQFIVTILRVHSMTLLLWGFAFLVRSHPKSLDRLLQEGENVCVCVCVHMHVCTCCAPASRSMNRGYVADRICFLALFTEIISQLRSWYRNRYSFVMFVCFEFISHWGHVIICQFINRLADSFINGFFPWWCNKTAFSIILVSPSERSVHRHHFVSIQWHLHYGGSVCAHVCVCVRCTFVKEANRPTAFLAYGPLFLIVKPIYLCGSMVLNPKTTPTSPWFWSHTVCVY